MLLEVELVKLGFLVPVAHACFCVVSVQHGVVMHQLYIYMGMGVIVYGIRWYKGE